jgi:hypothetical protein
MPVRRAKRCNVPITSFAAPQKKAGYFVVSDEPPYRTHVPVEEPSTASEEDTVVSFLLR